jgi:hypothetical protein
MIIAITATTTVAGTEALDDDDALSTLHGVEAPGPPEPPLEQ